MDAPLTRRRRRSRLVLAVAALSAAIITVASVVLLSSTRRASAAPTLGPSTGLVSRRTPTTLASVRGRIYAVAQSRTSLAWRTCKEVAVKRIDGRRYPSLPIPAEECHVRHRGTQSIERDVLLLLGSTVVWSEFTQGNLENLYFKQAAIGKRKAMRGFLPPTVLDELGGTFIAGPSSNGRAVAYGITNVSGDHPPCSDEQIYAWECPHRANGRVVVVDGRLGHRRVAASPVTHVAISAEIVAFIPLVSGTTGPEFRTPARVVRLVRVRSGRRVRDVTTSGTPLELALSDRLGAVLVAARGKREIAWFEPRTGRTLDRLQVARGTTGLAVVGRTIVYRAGARLLTFTSAHKAPRVAAELSGSIVNGTTADPNGLLWSETVRQGGRTVSRIRTLTLR